MNITVCDVCKDVDRPAHTYRVTRDGQNATTDRCEEHAKPFEEIFSEAWKKRYGPRRPVGRPPKSSTSRITTMEEIEERKRERRARA